MLHEFRWRGADVLRLLEESRQASERRMTLTQMDERGIPANAPEGADRGTDVPPGLNFVKDWGVYLMSNATRPPGINADAVYADGYGPDLSVRGDDFVEFLGADLLAGLEPTDVLVIMLDPSADTFEIRVQ